MKSIITTNDIKDMMKTIFNGNMGETPYFNENSEDIMLRDLDDGSETVIDLAEYLNITFFSWQNKQEVVEIADIDNNELILETLQQSKSKAYALVELLSDDMTESPDIDSSIKRGKVTFYIQADKVSNLDYYITKIRNKYLGEPFEILNSYGKLLKAFITFETMTYDEEPTDTQGGYTLVTSVEFTLAYMDSAQVYSDTKVEMSLDNGKHFYEMPITQETWQVITSSEAVVKALRQDLTGQLVTAIASAKTFSFFDFNKKLNNELDKLFWSIPAINVNGIPTKKKDNLNIPIKLRVTNNGNVYFYDDVIDNIEKVMQNNTYNTSSLSLKGNAYPSADRYVYFDNGARISLEPRQYANSKELIANTPISLMSGQHEFLIPLDNDVVFRTMFFVTSNADCTIRFDFKVNDIMSTKIVQVESDKVVPIIIDNEMLGLNNAMVTFNVKATSSSDCTLQVLNTEEYASSIAIL